jgi:hypothetical protein
VRIVLAGATGFLGRPLVTRLLAAGHTAIVLTRRPRGSPGFTEVAWSPDGTAGPWAGALHDADAVVNLAGESIAARRWTDARKAVISESRLLPTRSLAAAIAKASPRSRVLLSASGVGYYGPHGAEEITEATPPGTDFLGRLCVQWEGAAGEARSARTRVVTVRTGLVLARNGGALAPMLRPFRLGVGGPFGNGRQYWPWIHRDDWTRLVEFVLAQPGLEGPLNFTAPEPVTNEVFSRTLAQTLRRPCLFRVPAFALRLAMGELADGLLLSGQRAVPARAQSAGFRFQHENLEAALRAILQ